MTDTIVWISGASSGIGAALAATVPFDDAHIIDISRSGGAPNTEHLPADLADPGSWSLIEEHFIARLGAFDGSRAVFVHNAGTLTPMGFAGEVDSAGYRAAVLLNSAAPQALGHGFLRAAAAFDGRADLALLTSGAASSPYEGWSSYCAGKAAVNQWVRTVGLEQARRGGCRVVAVAPGAVATPMQEQIRATHPHDFPEVAKFADLHDSGELREPTAAGRGVWELLERDLDNGAIVDLRDLDERQ